MVRAETENGMDGSERDCVSLIILPVNCSFGDYEEEG